MGRENDAELHAKGWQARLLVLQRASLAFARLSDVRDIGNEIIRVLEQLLPYERSAIVVVDRQSGDLRLIAHSSAGLDPDQAADEFSRVEELIQQSKDAGVIRNVIRTGIRSRVDDVETYKGYIAGDGAMRSELCVPVNIAGTTIGALNVESLKAFAFGAEDESLLTILANQVALALENAWLTDMADEHTRMRIQAESERMAAEHLLAEAINTYSDGMALFDENDILRLHNGRLIEIHASISVHLKNGVAAQFLNEVVRDKGLLAAGADPGSLLDNLFLGKLSPGSRIVETADGRMIEIQESAIETGGRICLHSDITERVKTERALAQAQRVEAIGRLTAGVAHDFNNLLAVIMGNLELAEDGITDPELGQFIDASLKATRRGAHMTKQLLAFGQRSTLFAQVTDVSVVVSGLTQTYRKLLPPDMKVRTAFDGNLWQVEVDPIQLETALQNLIVNARDAMPDNGTLSIRCSNALLKADDAVLLPDKLLPGEYVLIEVADTGSGMTPDVAAKAIEPFFTTKPVGKGTGLGLPMVVGFVLQSGGTVRILSEVGQGTCIQMYFPRAKAADRLTPDAPTARPVIMQRKSRGCILIVDDLEEVRTVMTGRLNRLGFETIEASDGSSALAILASGVKVDLLIADIVMPGQMQGPDLVKIVRLEYPALKTMLMSGNPNSAKETASLLSQGVTLLPKPISRADLEAAIGVVLQGA